MTIGGTRVYIGVFGLFGVNLGCKLVGLGGFSSF